MTTNAATRSGNDSQRSATTRLKQERSALKKEIAALKRTISRHEVRQQKNKEKLAEIKQQCVAAGKEQRAAARKAEAQAQRAGELSAMLATQKEENQQLGKQVRELMQKLARLDNKPVQHLMALDAGEQNPAAETERLRQSLHAQQRAYREIKEEMNEREKRWARERAALQTPDLFATPPDDERRPTPERGERAPQQQQDLKQLTQHLQEAVDAIRQRDAYVAELTKRLETSVPNADETSWYIRLDSTEILGPMSQTELLHCAQECRLAPDHEISSDRQTWRKTHEVAELGMEWMIELIDGSTYGPVHLCAVPHLIDDHAAHPNARLIHRVSGREWRADCLPQPELLEKLFSAEPARIEGNRPKIPPAPPRAPVEKWLNKSTQPTATVSTEDAGDYPYPAAHFSSLLDHLHTLEHTLDALTAGNLPGPAASPATPPLKAESTTR